MGEITVQQMKDLEKSSKLPVIELMENAGKQIFETLKGKVEGKKVLIVCYHGNNGGDGFVAAKYLSEICEVDVLFLGDETKLKKEALINYKKVLKNYNIQLFKDPNIDYNDYDIIIDAMLGTGIEGLVKEPLGAVIDLVNNSKAKIVSIDVPTGINPDTGESANKAVEPDMIIALHAVKKGLEKFRDKTVVVDIGIR